MSVASAEYMAGECSVCGHARSECRGWRRALNLNIEEPTRPDDEEEQ